MGNMNDMGMISALVELGVLSSMLGNKPKTGGVAPTDVEKVVDDSAKNQKRCFDSLVSAGFTEEQAFQLVKEMLGSVKTVNITLK